MKIKDLPEDERPREKLMRRGAVALSNAELLAIFLRTGIPGKSAIDLAHDLLNDFGSLRALMAADQKRFCQAQGLGEAKFAQVQAVIEMVRRYLEEEIKRPDQLTSPEQTKNYLRAKLRGAPNEIFACIFLDNRHRVITYEELFHGTIDGASVYPRVVVQRALQHNAAALILAHNHPSGVTEPSNADQAITRRLKDALAMVDIRVLDHMIIGDSVTSMAELGMV